MEQIWPLTMCHIHVEVIATVRVRCANADISLFRGPGMILKNRNAQKNVCFRVVPEKNEVSNHSEFSCSGYVLPRGIGSTVL